MADFIATFTNPKQNYDGSGGASEAIGITSAQPHFEFGQVSSMDLQIDYDVIVKYGLETLITNACQLFSSIDLSRASAHWFQGYVADKPLYKEAGGRRYLSVSCNGHEGRLLKALVPSQTGAESWTVQSSTFNVGAISPYLPMEISEAFGTFVSPTLWPDPLDTEGAKCYLQDSDCPSDTIHANILSTDVAPFYVELTTNDAALSPQGWLMINGEWFYYEGYDATGGGNRFRVQILSREELGTTAANHLAGDTAYNKIAKRIGPEPARIFKDGTELRQGDDYTVQVEYGCFVLTADAGGSNFTGNYYVYDEDAVLDAASVVINLEDVIELIVTAPKEYGGAGFDVSECNFDPTGIAITRYDYNPKDKSLYAWNAIQELLEGLNLKDEVEFFYDHSDGVLRLIQLGNAASPDFTITHTERVEAEMSGNDLYSALRIEYTNDQDPNLCQVQYAKHVDADTTGPAPEIWRESTADAENWQAGTNTVLQSTDPQDPQYGLDVCIDGKLDTRLQAEISHDPGGPFVHSTWWFGPGNTPQSILLDKIQLWVNGYRSTADRSYTNENHTYVVKVQGCNDYDVGADTGTWFDLGKRLEGTGEREAKWVVLEMSEFIVRTVNAVRIVFEYMAGPIDSGHKYWATVHNFVVQGNITKYVLIQTTDDAAKKTNPRYIYNVDAHKKLRGAGANGSAGSPICRQESIGAASDGAAITIGRAYLQSSLINYQRRNYHFEGEWTTKPELGVTIATDEDADGSADYTGVLRMLDLDLEANSVAGDYSVIDYDAPDVS